MIRPLVFAAGAIALTGCATPEPKEPPLEGIITLSAGPCLGLCPVYSMRVDPEDRYRLNAEANTIKPGRSEGGLPVGTFRRALDLMERYDFEQMQRSYTGETPETCPDRVTGTPTLTIQRKTDDTQKLVTYEVGCLDFAEKDRLDLLVGGLYRQFRINDLVSVGEPPKIKDKNDTIGDAINSGGTL